MGLASWLAGWWQTARVAAHRPWGGGCTKPTAPTGLYGISGNDLVTLYWTAPGGTVTSYDIYLNTLYWGNTGSSATSGTVTGLVNGTKYEFTVAAVNSCGTGPQSSAAWVTPFTTAGAPSVAATAGDTQVGLAITPPSSDGGSVITTYNIYRNNVLVASTANLNYTDTGLTDGVTYTYQVTAVNGAGESAKSSPASATPFAAATVPDAPTSLHGTPSTTSVALAWTAPANNGGSAITGYNIYRNSVKVNTSATTSFNDTGLATSTAYSYYVTAVNAVGESVASNTINVTTGSTTVPSAPTLSSVTGGNATSTVNWTTPASDGGSAITGYKVYRGTTSGGETLLTTLGVVLTFNDSGLTNGTTYYYEVTAINANGESVKSNELSVVPTAVTYYVATNGSDSNSGTSTGSPWATLSHAFSAASVGATVLLRGGTYNQPFFSNARDAIIVMNYPGEAVNYERTGTGMIVNIQNFRNVTFKKNPGGGSFTFKQSDTAVTGGNGAAIHAYTDTTQSNPYGQAQGLTLDGLVITNITGYGVWCTGAQTTGVSNLTIQNCDISHCGEGIQTYYVSGTSIITNNTVHDVNLMVVNNCSSDFGGIGISAGQGTTGLEISYNTIYNCHAPSCQFGVDGGAVEIYGCSNVKVHHNTCHDNEGFIETGTGNSSTYPTSGNNIYFNTVYGAGEFDTTQHNPTILLRAALNGIWANNTFDIDNGQDVVRFQIGGSFAGSINNVQVKNNIFRSNLSTDRIYVYNGFTSPSVTLNIDYNLLINSTGSSATVAATSSANYNGTQLASWRTATSQSAHDVWNADPQFVNSAGRNYNIANTSPAYQTGVVIAGITSSPTPNMGAY